MPNEFASKKYKDQMVFFVIHGGKWTVAWTKQDI